jgi:hypothetical protein
MGEQEPAKKEAKRQRGGATEEPTCMVCRMHDEWRTTSKGHTERTCTRKDGDEETQSMWRMLDAMRKDANPGAKEKKKRRKSKATVSAGAGTSGGVDAISQGTGIAVSVGGSDGGDDFDAIFLARVSNDVGTQVSNVHSSMEDYMRMVLRAIDMEQVVKSCCSGDDREWMLGASHAGMSAHQWAMKNLLDLHAYIKTKLGAEARKVYKNEMLERLLPVDTEASSREKSEVASNAF